MSAFLSGDGAGTIQNFALPKHGMYKNPHYREVSPKPFD
jgi:hypothetical protein